MTKGWGWRVLLVLLPATGCSSPSPAPVPLVAAQADIMPIAGDWKGSFTNSANGQRGAIRFSVPREEKTALAKVVLIAAGHTFQPANAKPNDPPAAGGQKLIIRFVRIDRDTLSGVVEPYTDPDCGCVVSSTFTGKLVGDAIEGTFVNDSGPEHPKQSGVWSVVREK